MGRWKEIALVILTFCLIYRSRAMVVVLASAAAALAMQCWIISYLMRRQRRHDQISFFFRQNCWEREREKLRQCVQMMLSWNHQLVLKKESRRAAQGSLYKNCLNCAHVSVQLAAQQIFLLLRLSSHFFYRELTSIYLADAIRANEGLLLSFMVVYLQDDSILSFSLCEWASSVGFVFSFV